jgi:organic hydroperoxide reductase OsmC/OhrA
MPPAWASAGDLDFDGSAVSASVSIGARPDGGFGLAVELDVHVPALDHATAESLVADAHHVYPYANATRGNIEVALSVV